VVGVGVGEGAGVSVTVGSGVGIAVAVIVGLIGVGGRAVSVGGIGRADVGVGMTAVLVTSS
jgi:hypothetical protein